jgi:hypothetical protein
MAVESLEIGVGTVLEQIPDTLVVVPVVLPDQHEREVLGSDAPGLHDELQGRAVVALRRVIDDLLVVGVRASLEEQAGQLGVMGDTGRAVERGLEFRVRPSGPKPGIGIGARIEQRGGGSDERVRARLVQAQIPGEAQMDEGVPTEWARGGGGARRIVGQEAAHRGVVAEHRRGMDVATRDVGMRRENRLRALQGAVPERGLEEGQSRIARQRRHVRGEPGPTLEAVRAGDDELRVRQREPGVRGGATGARAQARVVVPHTTERFGVARLPGLEEVLRLLLVLLEVGMGREIPGIRAGGHTKLLSCVAWSPPASG